MKHTIYLLFFTALFISTSCGDLLKDTDFDPIYYVECDIDGEFFRAQTNNNAWMIWYAHIGDEYEVIGQDVPNDMQVILTLFEQLGENEICAGTNVNSYLTDITYYHDNKSYSALRGGGGCVDVERLTDTEVEGTFEAMVADLKNPSDMKEITNGLFYVKTR